MQSHRNGEGGETEEFAEFVLLGVAPSGDATAEFEGGVIEVFGGIPGERVVVRIHRRRYGRRRRREHTAGIVVQVLDPSPHRIIPPCPYFGPCSGCEWQHIDYPHQLRMKTEIVRRAMEGHELLRGVPIAETIASPNVLGYRNHARMTVRRQGRMGFTSRVTRRFVDIERCLLMDEGINDLITTLQGKVGETTQLSMRYGTGTGECLIQPAMQNAHVPIPTGQTHYRERLFGRQFRIASPSFFQVNTCQAETLGNLVLAGLRLQGSETVVDAYAGVGTFSALISVHAGRLVAIEESSAAIRDARINVRDLTNIEFIEAKTEVALAGLSKRPDAIVLDPPRAGCHPDAVEAVVNARPGRVVYVSCDPVTLARDLSLLSEGGFDVECVQPVDMFPQTHHVECVAALIRA